MIRFFKLYLLKFAAFFSILLLTSCIDKLQTQTMEPSEKINGFSLTATARSNLEDELTASTHIALPDEIRYTAEEIKETEKAIRYDLLPVYELDVEEGKLVWVHPPVKIIANEDNQAVFRQDHISVNVENFLVGADIRWQTSSNASGCGFSLRTHGENRNLNRYLVILTRVSYGHIQFTALSEGKPANIKEIYLDGLDPQFSWENQSSNWLAVKAQGNLLTIYVNQTRIGEIDAASPPNPHPDLPPPGKPQENSSLAEIDAYNKLDENYQDAIKKIEQRYKQVSEMFHQTKPVFSSGFVGFAAVNHTGQTMCEFSNAWLWSLDSSISE
jgi:hypothetical protein